MIKLDKNDVLLFSGDSITEGMRVTRMDCNHIFGHGYQYIAAGELALAYASEAPKFINKAYSGYTMYQLADRWEEDVIANKPTVVSLLAGTNDGNIGFDQKISPEENTARYSDALSRCIEQTEKALPGTRFIVCEPFYFPLDRSDLSYKFTPHPDCEAPFTRPDSGDTDERVEYRLCADKLIRAKAKEIAEKYGCTFVSFHDTFVEAMKNARREYFTWDGTHPTIAGHMLMAKKWLKDTAEL